MFREFPHSSVSAKGKALCWQVREVVNVPPLGLPAPPHEKKSQKGDNKGKIKKKI